MRQSGRYFAIRTLFRKNTRMRTRPMCRKFSRSYFPAADMERASSATPESGKRMRRPPWPECSCGKRRSAGIAKTDCGNAILTFCAGHPRHICWRKSGEPSTGKTGQARRTLSTISSGRESLSWTISERRSRRTFQAVRCTRFYRSDGIAGDSRLSPPTRGLIRSICGSLELPQECRR